MLDADGGATFCLLIINGLFEFVFVDLSVSNGPPVFVLEFSAHCLQLHRTKDSFLVCGDLDESLDGGECSGCCTER